MATNKSSVIALLRQPAELPALYKATFNKDWDSSKPILECAKALASKGIELPRRQGVNGGTGTGINVPTDDPKQGMKRIRSAMRRMVDNAWNASSNQSTQRFYADDMPMATAVCTVNDKGYEIVLTIGDKSETFINDQLPAAHALGRAYGIK